MPDLKIECKTANLGKLKARKSGDEERPALQFFSSFVRDQEVAKEAHKKAIEDFLKDHY
jgi:hypothetical protein